ncbi:nucleolar and coiled-body phosphoprotein 1-like isoform X1 [Plutella xylostella]|uniref:nucleolar and coiled-body phosphoprotein 1-like isoform X1 n=1 Tax=Plutella xylostella TaxID=51655 RepID=UPI002032C7A7|nr:nucleolar and coiled-body phosphoprotein 1-like isoform X1 [Plutella xylostella]XP_037973855.2 nucleolar and coiled-body phosphoprotein 1-like isoform X1 [Plutella xylostella]
MGQKTVIVKKKGTLKGARFCTSAPSCFPVRSKHRADPCPNPQDCHRNCTGKEKEEEEPGCNKNCEGNKPKSKELNCDCIRIQSTHSISGKKAKPIVVKRKRSNSRKCPSAPSCVVARKSSTRQQDPNSQQQTSESQEPRDQPQSGTAQPMASNDPSKPTPSQTECSEACKGYKKKIECPNPHECHKKCKGYKKKKDNSKALCCLPQPGPCLCTQKAAEPSPAAPPPPDASAKKGANGQSGRKPKGKGNDSAPENNQQPPVVVSVCPCKKEEPPACPQNQKGKKKKGCCTIL